MARLSYAERLRLPSSAFVYPRTRRYPIEDLSHGRNAIARAHQFGSPGSVRTVERAVHRAFPSIDIERHNPENPDLVGQVMSLGLLIGGGILAFGWLKAGGSGAIGGWLQSLVPQGGGSPAANPVATPTPTPVTSPTANSGANSFNFNDSTISLSLDGQTGTLTAFAGFGHIGPGGVFMASIVIRTPPSGGWQTGYGPTQVVVGNDADWNGYHIGPVNFDASSALGLGTPIVGVDVQFLIDGGSGERYTQTAVHNVR